MSDQVLTAKQPAEKASGEATKKKILRWTVLIAAILLVALIVCCILFPRVFNPDRVGRYLHYLPTANDSTYGQIRFDSNSSDSYAIFNGKFAAGCEDGLYLYDDRGEQTALVQGSLPYPKICTCDSVALCYSNESSTLVALDRKGATALNTTASGTVLDCELSSDGCVCYAASDSGCKTQVTVLNRDLQEIYKWKSFSQYLNCCAVSDKAERLAVVGLNQVNSVFCSTLSILRTDSEEDAVVAEAELGNQIIYELWFLQQDRLCAIGENCTLLYDTEGNCLQTYDYAGMTLTDFTRGKNGDLFLSFDRNKSGKSSLLVSLTADGEQLAEREYEGEIRSITANGKYLAVLTDLDLSVCDEKLEEYSRTEDYTAANRALARKDGSVLLVSNGQTSLYIP